MVTDRQTAEVAPFWPRRNWWLALLGIVVLAGLLRFPGYDFSLPFVEHVGVFADESYYLLTARMAIDQGSAKPLNMHHYPPGIIAVNYLALRFFQDPSAPPGTVLPGLRLLAILVSVVTTITLALLGYHVANPLAGLIAGALWAITPTMVAISHFATSDIYVTFLTVLTVWLLLVGYLYERKGWLVGATYALMVAVTFKYSALAMAPLVLLTPLLKGRSSLPIVASNIGRFVIFAGWLVFLTPFLEAFSVNGKAAEVDNLAWVGAIQIDSLTPSLTSFLAIFARVAAELDLLPLILGWLGLSLLVRKGGKNERFASVFIPILVLTWFLEMSLVHSERLLYAIPPLSLLILLAGIGYALLWQTLAAWLRRFVRLRWLPAAAALALLFLLNLPNLQAAITDLRDRARPDQRNFLAAWADSTLPPSQYITTYDNHRTLNREWGGYAGETRFKYVGSPFDDTTIAEWRAQGALFAIAPHFHYELWREGGTDEFVTETTLLKSYPASNAYRDPGMVVLLLKTIQHEATGQLGPIRLIGYDLGEDSARPGHTFPFHLYWQSSTPTATDYQVFNHLIDEEGRLVAQVDGPPLPDPLLRRGTSNWDDPKEIIYSREYALPLPENLAAGEYTLVTGFYRRDDGQRLFTATGEDSLRVTRIVVE